MYPEFSSWLSYQTILHPNHARFVLSLAENAGGKCHDSELYLAEVRWLKLDMPSIRGRGTLLDKVDLSKVDAVGLRISRPEAVMASAGSPMWPGSRCTENLSNATRRPKATEAPSTRADFVWLTATRQTFF
jgi:hypothetical protein